MLLRQLTGAGGVAMIPSSPCIFNSIKLAWVFWRVSCISSGDKIPACINAVVRSVAISRIVCVIVQILLHKFLPSIKRTFWQNIVFHQAKDSQVDTQLSLYFFSIFTDSLLLSVVLKP
jgi:hypothetical protein